MYFDVDSYSHDEFEGEQDDFDFEEKMRTSRLPPMTTVTRTVMLTNLTVRK